MARPVYLPTDEFWSGYAGLGKEDMDYLRSRARPMPFSYGDMRGLPERVDPRLDEKFTEGWMRVENQGGVGAPFSADTEIVMADGSVKALEDLKVGDRVAGISNELASPCEESVSQVVTELHQLRYTGNAVSIYLSNGQSFECTENHQLVPIGSEPVAAIEVKVGDRFPGVRPGEMVDVTGVSTHCVMDEIFICPTVDPGHLVSIAGCFLQQCQGYGLIHCVEYLYAVLTGDVVQLSPMFAYLMSQYYDGIRGDRGSTLSGGTKVLEGPGLCLLEEYSRERSYPRNGYKDIPQTAIEAAKNGPFRTLKATRFRDAGEYRAFTGSYAGIAQTGTKWTSPMASPPSHGVIQSVGGRSFGGHSWNFCGFMPIDELGAEARRAVPRTRGEFVNIATNSHNTQWADSGFGYFTDEQFNELNRSDLILGRTDMGDIKPRASKLDFTTKRHSRFVRND